MSAGRAHELILSQEEATRERAQKHLERQAAVARLLADLKRKDPNNLPGKETAKRRGGFMRLASFWQGLQQLAAPYPPPHTDTHMLSPPPAHGSSPVCLRAAGALRPAGARHDNDHVDFSAIRVVPTAQELLCPLDPCLPANRWATSG